MRSALALLSTHDASAHLFARVDVLRKTGTRIELIEVKAKSFESTTNQGFRGARGGIDGGMKPYLQNLAFPRHVLGLAHPQLRASSFLMLTDAAKTCSVDGLHQRFRIRRVDGQPVVTVAPGADERTIGTPVLACVNVDDLVDEILREPIEALGVTSTLGSKGTVFMWSPHENTTRPSTRSS